ncbi:MAG: hypothetical protein V3W19_10565 [Desulfatiglandales bacterium]
MNPEEIMKLGRGAIIRTASERIDDSSFKVENFDIIKVKVIAKRNDVWVTFNMSFRYVPINSCFYYAVAVGLVSEIRSMSPICNPDNFKGKKRTEFFQPTEESKKAVAFVIDVVSNSENDGNADEWKLSEDTTMTIYDNAEYFSIQVESAYQVSFYKIAKDSGRIYDEGHEHMSDEEELSEQDGEDEG